MSCHNMHTVHSMHTVSLYIVHVGTLVLCLTVPRRAAMITDGGGGCAFNHTARGVTPEDAQRKQPHCQVRTAETYPQCFAAGRKCASWCSLKVHREHSRRCRARLHKATDWLAGCLLRAGCCAWSMWRRTTNPACTWCVFLGTSIDISQCLGQQLSCAAVQSAASASKHHMLSRCFVWAVNEPSSCMSSQI
jgi:hypothetical protein